MTVPINEHYGKGAKMCGQVITFFFKISIKSESVSCSVVSDSAIPWTIARQAPLSMEFSRQEYWSRLPFPSPGYLPKLWTEPGSPTLQADFLLSDTF